MGGYPNYGALGYVGGWHPAVQATAANTIRAKAGHRKRYLKNLTRMRMDSVRNKYKGMIKSGLVDYNSAVGARSAYASEINNIKHDYVYQS